MSPWIAGQKGISPTESTWMPEEIELAPEWVREEYLRPPEECRAWLDSQQLPSSAASSPKRGRGRRGRRPRGAM